MESRNPVIRRYADFQKPGSVLGNNQGTVITSTPVESSTKTFPGTTPAKPGERVVTMDDVVMKSFGMFALLLAGAFVGWNAPGLAIIAAIAGLVLGLVNTFKKNVSPALILAYALLQGVFVGGISCQVHPHDDGGNGFLLSNCSNFHRGIFHGCWWRLGLLRSWRTWNFTCTIWCRSCFIFTNA